MLLYPEFTVLFFLLLPIAFLLYRNYRLGRKEFQKVKGTGPVRSLYDAFTIKWVFVSLFYFLALVFIILSLVGIRSEKKNIEQIPEKADVVFALDISRSMLANDVAPSRLSRSLNLINNITGRLQNARFGIVVFKGEGYILVPVTEDREAINQAVDVISPSLFTSSSTNLAAGLETALEAFPRGEDRRRLIVFISDGEAHTGNVTEIAERAKEDDIGLDVLGVGTRDGGQIPVGDDQYLRDQDGAIVVSKLNTAILRKVAEINGGSYCEVNSLNSLNELFSCLSINKDQDMVKFEEQGRYALFLLLAVCLLILSILVKVIPWHGTY